jgi:TfoX/Sxy family transcriptional regulator of competence genes
VTDERWGELVESAVGGPVTQGTMFGSKGLRTGKKYFATWWNGQLVLKLPADRVEELVRSDQGEPFEPMAGRPMKGWVVVAPTADWPALSAEARAFVESQPR